MNINNVARSRFATFEKESGNLSTIDQPFKDSIKNLTINGSSLYVQNIEGQNNERRTAFTVLDKNTGQIIEANGFSTVIISSPSESNIPKSTAIEASPSGNTMVSEEKLGFKIPSLSEILTFVIRIFFFLGGLAAFVFMLLGAFAWITSCGDKEAITAAREKIQAAIIGIIMMVVVLGIV